MVCKKISYISYQLLILLFAVFVFAGCQNAEKNRDTKLELIVGAGTDVAVSGAFQARLGVYPLNINVAEPLVRLSPDYKVEPSLATSWEYRGENTWRFFLRKNVKFHDGQAFTADAVRKSFVELIKGKFGYSYLTEESVKVIDNHTIDITPSETNLPLPQQLVHPNYSIFAPGTDPSVKPIGTGAFKLEEYRPNEWIIVSRNNEYWGEKAKLEKITFRFLPDATTRVLALQAGEVDLIIDLPREQTDEIESQKNLKVVRSPVGLIMSFQLNMHGKEPYTILADRSPREAIGMAIDRSTLVKKIWNGEGSDVQNMTVPAILGSHAGLIKGFSYDQDKAKQVLENAGWVVGDDGIREKNNRRLQLVMLANPEIDAGTVEFIQAGLKDVGIDARWNKLPDIGTFSSRQYEGQFDLSLTLSNQNDANPLFLPALIYYSKSGRPFARWTYVGDKFDKLIEKGLRSSEPEEAKRIAAESIQVAIDEEAAMIPVAGLKRIYGMKKSVQGFSAHPSSDRKSVV